MAFIGFGEAFGRYPEGDYEEEFNGIWHSSEVICFQGVSFKDEYHKSFPSPTGAVLK